MAGVESVRLAQGWPKCIQLINSGRVQVQKSVESAKKAI